MTYITNDCLAFFIYKKLNTNNLSPLIASLFESDEQYVKFCENFNEYIKMTPVFGEPKMKVKDLGRKNPPCMFLGDIEIHWVHEKNKEDVLEKWNRRIKRIESPKFYWSDDQMFNGYSEELKQRFMRIPNSVFIETKNIEGYIPKSLDYNKLGDYVLGGDYPEIHTLWV